MATIEFTSAPSGTGKTFERCARFMADQWLPNESGVHFSNFPVYPDKMVAHVLERHPDMHEGELLRRIHLIDAGELKKWRSEESGPWDYFKDMELDAGHIAIDEIHNFVHSASSKEYVQKWKEWAGELRHRGCTVEFLSQHEAKVHSLIRREAGLKRSLFNGEERRDPWLKIKMMDWYNLRAAFLTGKYKTTIFATEQIVVNGHWKESHTHRFVLGPPYFDLYNSYSAPIAGGKAAKGKLHPYQQRSRGKLLGWFFARNWETLLFRFGVLALIIFIFCNSTWLMREFFEFMQAFAPKKHAAVAAAPVPVGAVTAASQPGLEAGATQNASNTGNSAVMPEYIQQLKKDLEDVKAKNVAMEAKIKAAEEEKARSVELVAITDKTVLFRSGQAVQLGEKIEFGPYKGKILHEIFNARHYVILDDGTRLYLAH